MSAARPGSDAGESGLAVEVTDAVGRGVVLVEPSNAPEVSIIVVTYGTEAVVVDAIAAIAASTQLTYEVIVVDNAPPLGVERTAELLRRRTSGVLLVVLDDNRGFAGGNEIGVDMARGAMVCFLNPDLIVADGWLEPLVAALDDPAVAIATPPLLDPDGTLQEAGQLLYNDACTAAIGGPEVLTGDRAQLFARDVDYASAACWLVRRAEHVGRGGFDPGYHPAFFEDVDYALRVEEGGQVTRLVVDRPVVHLRGHGGAGRGLATAEASQQVFKSKQGVRIARQPDRATSDADAIAGRDRSCTHRIAVVAPAPDGIDIDAVALAFADLAASRPRDRVTLLTDRSPGAVDEHRRRGLEVVIGEVAALTAARAAHPTAVVRIGAAAAAADGFAPTIARVGDGDIGGLVDRLATAEQPAPEGWRAGVVGLVRSPWTWLVVLAGVVMRVMVIGSGFGELNADEAYTGLQAMAILDGHFPVVIAGNAYTAVLESYLFAPLTPVLGGSAVALKLISVVFWALAALALAGAVQCLAGRRAGLLAAALLWLAPGALAVVSTRAYVGYALGMALVVATWWAINASLLAGRPAWHRSVAIGGLAGLAFYAHPMFVAVLAPMLVVPAWCYRAHLRRWWLPAVAAATIANAGFLAWNAKNSWPSLTYEAPPNGTYGSRLGGFFTDLLPRAFGLETASGQAILPAWLTAVVIVALVAAAAFGAAVIARRAPRPVAVVALAPLVCGWFVMAAFSNLGYSADGRYAIITLPFLLAACATGIDAATRHTAGPFRLALPALWVIAWSTVLFVPFWWDATDGDLVDANEGIEEVIDRLEAAGINRVAGTYWRVLTIEYLSDRDVRAAVVGNPFVVRFPESQRIVAETPDEQVAFVFEPGLEDTSRLRLPVASYRREVVGNTVVYLPPGARG